MGLGDLPGVNTELHPERAYSKHPKEDELWEWFEELESRFPEPIECAFIEVSPRMTKHNAKAYYDRESVRGTLQYIRFSENYIERSIDELIKETLLHEMVHLYTYQNGYHTVSDGSHIFKWLCGAVGAKINQVRTSSNEWQTLAEPFRSDQNAEENSS